MAQVKQMPLKTFIEEYGVPRATIYRLIYSVGFPAFKIGRNVYIDIPRYEEWREKYRVGGRR